MRALLALTFLLSATVAARADIILGSADAARGTPGAAGLAGTYYHEGSGTTGFSLGKTLALMAASTATGTFTTTAINYSGNDASTITAFLGADRASYAGPAAATGDLSDAILHLTGFFYAAQAETITFAMAHDDAAQLTLGGKVALASNIGTDSANVTFAAPGYYAFDLVYANTNYNNGTGGANLALRANGTVLTAAVLVQTVVPEPASQALLGTVLVAAGLARRHRSR